MDPESERNQILWQSTLREIIRTFSPMPCWKVGLYYGTWVYFEMGEKIKQKMKDGTYTDVGSGSLSLDGDRWIIYDGDTEIAKSETISRDIAETRLGDLFFGNILLSIDIDEKKKQALIYFSSHLNIRIYPNDKPIDQMDDYDEIVTLFLPDGRIVYYNPAKGLRVAADLDSTRQAYWKKKTNGGTAAT